jgi:hypothetical protein
MVPKIPPTIPTKVDTVCQGITMRCYAAFFRLAQRAFCASLIFLRAAAESRRRPFLMIEGTVLTIGLVAVRLFPRRAVMALLSRSLSASNSAMIDCVSKGAEVSVGLRCRGLF